MPFFYIYPRKRRVSELCNEQLTMPREKEEASKRRMRARRNRLWSRIPAPSEIPVVLVLGDLVEVVKFLDVASYELKQPEPQYDDAGKSTVWLHPILAQLYGIGLAHGDRAC